MQLRMFLIHRKNSKYQEDESNSPGWPWRIQDFGGGNYCGCGGNSKEQELKMEPEYVTELLQYYDKTVMDESFFLWISK